MYTAVYKSLLSHVRTYTVTQREKELVGGEVEETTTEETKRLAVLPMTSRQLQVLNTGEYTTQDVNAYEINDLTLAVGSEFQYRGASYRVKDVKDYRGEGGFVRYLCKKQ